MARQRRRGGFSPPELRGTLGTLLRTTLQQAGVVRDALARGASEGRSRLDDFRTDLRSNRRRQEALAELGEVVLDLIRRGEIDLAELPEARAVIDHLEEIDANADAEDVERDSSPTIPPPTRKRFDDRGTGARDSDDGTVSSARWSPPRRDAVKPTRVWKPDVEAAPVDAPDTVPGHKALPKRDPDRKGGISFSVDDSDDDLADYMHPDDVPPKKA
ncbi:MAG: hypothetical protein H0V17_36175 [Deltaproteobacteria bacterium]|nr:hypothetical protein [Deltaproteobacteria bacterium]